MSTSEEIEVGRRNLLAQLRHDLDRDLTEYPVDAATMRELVQVLGRVRAVPTREQMERHVRWVYINGGADVAHAREAAAEIADAVLNLMGGVKP